MVIYPKVQPTINNKYVLLEDYKFKKVRVPKGYETNGANVPRLFWWFVPPFKPKLLPAIIVHDYLCDKEEYKKADDHFKACLECLNVSKFTRYIMYFAVRIYHIIRYGK